MKYGFARAALVSPKVQPGAIDRNKIEILKTIRAASEKSAEIIMTERLSLSGYSCGNMFLYGNLLQGCIDALTFLVSETQNLDSIVIVGLPMKMADKIYDCSAVISGGKVLAIVPHSSTNHVFCDYPDGEISYIKINENPVPFGKKIVFYNTELDYSIKFSDMSSGLPHTEIVLRPLAAVKTMGSYAKEFDFCKNLSTLDACAVLSVSAEQTACAGQKIYDSFKLVCELGKNIEKVDSKNPDIAVADIDITGISHANTFAVKKCISHRDYLTVDFACNNNDFMLIRDVDKFPMCPASEDDCRDIIDILTASIKAKMAEAKHDKVILGVSGGLDSANVLMLCYKLFTREKLPLENIIAVTMNSSHTSKRTAGNAKRLIELLGATHIDLSITGAVKRHLKELEHEEEDTVYENAQARERTKTLLNLANKHNALLLGTGNLSELCLGWATYGGDLTAHYNPNGGITKTAIRVTVKYVAETLAYKEAGKTLTDILNTPVSPELKENQETENILGPYEAHDFFLHCLIYKGYDIEKTLFMAEKAFREKQRKDLFAMLKVFTERFFRYRFKQNYSCDSPAVLDESLSELLSGVRSGFAAEQWIKELNNLKA